MEALATKPKKVNKWKTIKVIQQHYGYGGGWEDNSEYDTSEEGYRDLLKHDLAEYRRTGYATRVITRKVLNEAPKS